MVDIQPGVAAYVSWDNVFQGPDCKLMLFRYGQDKSLVPYGVDSFHGPAGTTCTGPFAAITADGSLFFTLWFWSDGTYGHPVLRVFSWNPFVLLHEFELPVEAVTSLNSRPISPCPNGSCLLAHLDPASGTFDYMYAISPETGEKTPVASVPSNWFAQVIQSAQLGMGWSDGQVIPVAFYDLNTSKMAWYTLGLSGGWNPMLPPTAGNTPDFVAKLQGNAPNYMHLEWYENRSLWVHNADFTDVTKTQFPNPPLDPLGGGTPAFDTSEGAFSSQLVSFGGNTYLVGGPPNIYGQVGPGRMWVCQVFAAYGTPATFGNPIAMTTPDFGGKTSASRIYPMVGPGTLQMQESYGISTGLSRRLYFWDGSGMDMSYLSVPADGAFVVPYIQVFPDPYRLGNLTGTPHDQGRTFGRPS